MNEQIGHLLNMSLESLRGSNFESAEFYLKQVLELQSSNPHALRLLGVLSAQRKQYSEAIGYLNAALDAMPNDALAWSNLGNVYLELKELTHALDAYQKSLAIDPQYVEAWSNMGNALFALKRYEEALNHHHHALSLNPQYAQAYSNAGNALNHLSRFEEAITYYEHAILIDPHYPEAFFNQGNALVELKRYEEAILSYQSALNLNPLFEEAPCNIGVIYQKIGRYEDALIQFDKAITINPSHAESYFNKGVTLVDQKRFEEAIICFEKALSIKSDLDWVLGDLLHAKMRVCQWHGVTQALVEAQELLLTKKKVIQPFALLALSEDPRLHKIASVIYAEERYPAKLTLGMIPVAQKKEKIRIGYFSPDFRTHPVSLLTAELFEKHDRTRFEIIGFSLIKAPDEDGLRARLKDAFDIFIDAENLADVQIAKLAREMGIDIAVDLSGPTQHSRVGIMAQRAAPIQVNWLGYPGTFGASFIDYILADKVVIPEESRESYVEKVVYLPGTFMVDDSNRLPSKKIYTREEFGLPENAFIFCCFNNDYKFNKDVLDCWARILLQVPDSVLWISENNLIFRKNILSEFEQRGVMQSRIIFANRIDLMSDHLARIGLADLFLDTFPYNAHTTAVDSLKAGVPLVTLLGKSFAGRVAASLLRSVGLSELIATTSAQYEDIVCGLFRDRKKLLQFKKILIEARENEVLFNSKEFCRDIEDAFLMMHKRSQEGLPPEHLTVGE